MDIDEIMYQIICNTIYFDNTGKYYSPVQDSGFFHKDFRDWRTFKKHFLNEDYLFFDYWLTQNIWEENQLPLPFANLYLNEPEMIYWHSERDLFKDDYYKQLLPSFTLGLSNLSQKRNCCIVLYVPSEYLESNEGADFNRVVVSKASKIINDTYFELPPHDAMTLFSDYLYGYYSIGYGFIVDMAKRNQFWKLIENKENTHKWYFDILDTILLHFEPMRDYVGFTISSANISLKDFIVESSLKEINNSLLQYK